MDERVICFSEYFNLNKTQSELDFVNVPIYSDIPLFIDPYAISQRNDRWSIGSHQTIMSFFQKLIDLITDNKTYEALKLLSFLREPNETRFGYSRQRPRGAGIGNLQADQLHSALSTSSAIRTGFVQSLEECELMVEGINRDKISDLTTNIIRRILADYTVDQCNLLNIPTQQVSLPPYFCKNENRWKSDYYQLPVVEWEPILLVPKFIARFDPAYDHNKYYKKFILEYLQAEHLSAFDSLVHALKNGKLKVYKKDVERDFPKTKQNIFEFSKNHPKVLEQYREYLAGLEKLHDDVPLSDDDEIKIADILIKSLSSISYGSENASTYHNLMIGILEFIFFPNLIHPIKEREINEGRKRIDIVMENGARQGIFYFLPTNKQYPCAFIAFECKNYSKDVANPELDQMIGRFSTNRGKVGFICCRHLDSPSLFNQRCIDTFKDQNGLIIYLDDQRIIQLLQQIKENHRNSCDDILSGYLQEVWLG